MAALGLGVDIRIVAKSGVRVTLAMTASLIVLGSISYALIRVAGMPKPRRGRAIGAAACE